jgi:RecB family endonuclease NucS
MEIDIFAVDGDVAVAIEVKSRLSQRDVDEFLGKVRAIPQAFPHYTGYQIYGAVAGIEIDAGVDRYAYQQGLFVIQQTGDTVNIANDAAFRPMAW